MTEATEDEAQWLRLCAVAGRESPDPRTKIGCLIVGIDGNIRSRACNTYPNGILDNIHARMTAPSKYIWIEHAERNAIYLAARRGISTDGCIMVVQLTPCIECARAIIQAGITQVIVDSNRSAEYRSARYSAEHATALSMLAEARISIRFVTPP